VDADAVTDALAVGDGEGLGEDESGEKERDAGVNMFKESKYHYVNVYIN
jgi:hypothetical protein